VSARHILLWQDIRIMIVHKPEYFTGTDHLEITSEGSVPLPITETGYRSHFIPSGTLGNQSDAFAFVSEWLDEASQTKQWQNYLADSRQMSLF
jgi:hypothetical protein